MTARKTGTFARRTEQVLTREASPGQPASLADLLDDDTGKTEKRQDGATARRQEKRVRVEARVPAEIAETLREYAHQHRTSHAAVVAEALRRFFEQQHFQLVEDEKSQG